MSYEQLAVERVIPGILLFVLPVNSKPFSLQGSRRHHDKQSNSFCVCFLDCFPIVFQSHCRIKEELEGNNYYGVDRDHVHLLPQIEVPAIVNSSGDLAIQQDGHLVFKPHGHGDIHTLLFQVIALLFSKLQNALPSRWKQELGKKYILFMQDTNILAIYGFPSLLGVTSSQQLDFSSLGIVRKPGEKVGSICQIEDSTGRQTTCNIEYNEFERILQSVNGVGDEANENGNSA